MKTIDDPLFPGLKTAMTSEAMTPLIERALARHDIRLTCRSVSIKDIKYEPGVKCTILYELKLAADGVDRAKKQYFVADLLEKGKTPPPVVGSDTAADKAGPFPVGLHQLYLPDAGLMLYPFPHDPRIPWLKSLLDGRQMREHFNAIWSGEGIKARKVKVELLGYTPHMRASLSYRISVEDRNSGETAEWELIGKTNVFKRPSRLYQSAWAMWLEAGDKVRFPKPMGYLSQPKLTLQEKIAGERLGSLIGTPCFSDVLGTTAEYIGHFHQARIPLPAMRTVKDEVSTLMRWSNMVCGVSPDLARRVKPLRDEIAAQIEARLEPQCPIHADFHHTNVFADGRTVHLLDLEEMAYGDPAVDIGRFMASFRIPSLRATGSLDGIRHELNVFLERYQTVSPIDLSRVHLFEAATLFTSAAAAFRLQRPAWQEEILMLLDEIEASFALARPRQTRDRKAPGQTAKPPITYADRIRWMTEPHFLRTLLDEALGEVLDVQVTSCDISKVRTSERKTSIRVKARGWRSGKKWKARLLCEVYEGEGASRRFRRMSRESAKDPKAKPLAVLPRYGLLITEAEPESDLQPSTEEALFLELKRHIKGKGVVLFHQNQALAELARDLLPRLKVESCSEWDPMHAKTPHIVLLEVLENLEPAKATRLLENLDQALPLGGTLLVVMRNPALPTPKATRPARKLKQSEVKDMLRKFGRPEVWPNQPFAWLVMAVTRKDPKAIRTGQQFRDKRMEITASLCRGRVMEIGCGCGHLSKRIHEKGYQVLGLDMSRKKIEQARHMYPGVTFVAANYLSHASDDLFDTVILAEILEHVGETDGDALLAKAWKQVAPGGRLVVSVPNENMVPHPNHIRCFNLKNLTTMLQPFGKPVAITRQPYKWLLMTVDKPCREQGC